MLCPSLLKGEMQIHSMERPKHSPKYLEKKGVVHLDLVTVEVQSHLMKNPKFLKEKGNLCPCPITMVVQLQKRDNPKYLKKKGILHLG